MVKYNETKVKDRLSALDYQPVVADLALTGIGNMHDDLQAVFDGWLDGQELAFSFQGITVAEIMERESSDYLNALFTMSLFIKTPDLIETFRTVPPETFRRHCGGGAEL